MSTGIAYVNEVWNPICGCSKCSDGCHHCFAEKMAYRLACMGQRKYQKVISTDGGVWNGKVFCNEQALDKPLHWRQPRRILTCSMADLFHPQVPFEFIIKVWDRMDFCKEHKFLVLTKRIKRMSDFIYQAFGRNSHFDNIYNGVTVCTQAEADEKIPILLSIPGKHWLSIEPMLEEIKLKLWQPRMERLAALVACRPISHIENPTPEISLVVVGCESGPNRRPCNIEWIKSIVDQCETAGVKCFVKQIEIDGKVHHDPKYFPAWAQNKRDLRIRE